MNRKPPQRLKGSGDQTHGLLLVVNPYRNRSGGGRMVQEAFFDALAGAADWSRCEKLELAGNERGLRFLKSMYLARKAIRGAALVVFQGFYSPINIPLAWFAARAKVPYIIIPRGDYVAPRGQAVGVRNFFLKQILWSCLIQRRLRNAIAVVTTSELELGRLRMAGARPVYAAIVPDPFSPVSTRNPRAASAADERFALYLGRLALEKNLEFIVGLWLEVLASVPAAKLKLVGPDHHPEVRLRLGAMIADRGLAQHIEILPWVETAAKADLIQRARCVILPSFFESLGLTILEAVSFRTRFIASDQTPWHGLPAAAGAVLPLNPQLWVKQLILQLGAKDKVWIPDEVAEAVLQPFSLVPIRKRWAAVLTEVGFPAPVRKADTV